MRERSCLSRLRRVRVFLAALCVIMGLAISVLLGYRREMLDPRIAFPPKPVQLGFGDLAPPFTLPSYRGSRVALQDLEGSWSVLIFCRRGCGACEEQVDAVCGTAGDLLERVRVLAILSGSPPLTNLREPSTPYSSASGVDVLFDDDESVASAYCDPPFTPPFSVLLDPEGRVRYVQAGRIVRQGVDMLADVLRLVARPSAPDPETASAPLAPRFTLQSADEEPLSFGSASADAAVILTFVSHGCSQCEERLQRLQRFADPSGNAHLVTVVPELTQTSLEHAYPHQAVVADTDGSMRRHYGVIATPATILVRNGRVIMKKRFPDPDGQVVEALVGREVLRSFLAGATREGR